MRIIKMELDLTEVNFKDRAWRNDLDDDTNMDTEINTVSNTIQSSGC